MSNNTTSQLRILFGDFDYESGETPTWLSDDAKEVILMVVYSIIGVGITSFGVVANSINIIVFAKQGFQETVNVSLFAMAISDLGALISLLWVGISVNPAFKNADIPFVAEGVNYITGEWPHAICVRITGWLTALVTVERCLCVIFPLRVKNIVTIGRVKFIIVVIFILVIGSMSPNFYFTRMAWMFIPERNKTMYAVFYTEDKLEIDSVAVFVHSIVPSFVYFFIILFCTIVLATSLRRQTKWRQKSSATNAGGGGKEVQTANSGVSRDNKVIRLVVTLATIFIVCLLPHMVAILFVTSDPEFNLFGRRRNLFKITGAFVLNLEAVNSGVNIFIYYTMSTKYKLIFRGMFCRSKDKVEA